MTYYFPPRQRGSENNDQAETADLTGLPPDVLRRHGAVVLDPGRAAAIPLQAAPRPTVYRPKVLLIPPDLARLPGFFADVAAVLGPIGMSLVLPDSELERDHRRARLPRTAVLVPAGGAISAPVIDAWVALQALRAAAASGQFPALSEETVPGISLDHLLYGSAIEGAPAHGGGGSVAGGVTGPGATDAYTFNGGDTRMPVAMVADPPARDAAGVCTGKYGRRPVVAVVDTGMRSHPWLDVQAQPGGGYDTAPDGFVAVDPDIQKAIQVESELALAAGDGPRQVIREPWDTPVSANPLVGELDTHTGHGTFIAGIVRQIAPDARVLAIRVMFADGIVYESDLMCALGLLADRIARAEEGDLAAMVDVVSLSLGYFSESADDAAFTPALWLAIQELLQLGVTVVAAAGNFATSRPFFPAAFAGWPANAGQPLVISVGALNPDGSKALFSDDGDWVLSWATGAALFSTFPTDVNGSRTPQLDAAGRASLDLDDYSAGYALWSGTSFAAPALAAYLTQALLAGAAGDPGLRLDLPGAQPARDRALAALTGMGWPG